MVYDLQAKNASYHNRAGFEAKLVDTCDERPVFLTLGSRLATTGPSPAPSRVWP